VLYWGEESAMFITTLGCVALLGASAATASAPPGPEGQAVQQTCSDEWVVRRGDSPWHGYTSSAQEEAAGSHVQAVALAPGFEAPASLARYAAGGRPLLAIDRKARRVHVEAAFFSDLDRPDATRLEKGARAVIGTLKQMPPGLDYAAVGRFLVESQIIRTYWHIEARLCPGAVQDDAVAWRLELGGVHTYCTDRCQDDPVAFAVRIDKQSGEMSIEGR
jgi:hypothetical protein